MNNDYWDGLANEINKVFVSRPGLFDHRSTYPWLSGALGDPNSGIWFLAENPSLSQVERVQNPDGSPPTPEAQWWSSRGDKLFREKLVKYHFKTNAFDALGSWKCYITNIIKEADYTKHWREKTQTARNQAAENWAGVLAWELRNSKPKLVVVMGGQTMKLVSHISSQKMVSFPKIATLTHYAYIGQRAQGRLGPMHPDRIEAYDGEFARIRSLYDSIK